MSHHVDILIIGAGLSGIGAACHLQDKRPGTTFTILESREALGGTWDLFRYPGVRSDSDMFTLGYGFRPWDGEKSIASGESIRDYIAATAAERGIEEHIRYGRRVTGLAWDSDRAIWTATAELADGGSETITTSFVYACTGYYRYDEGYTPELAGLEDFAGEVVHPQHWPQDLDLAGRRVVVIGSGATAMTLVPSLAGTAEHVTMLQRSPTYVASLPDTDVVADLLRRVLPGGLAHPAIRWKNVAFSTATYQLSRHAPGVMKALLRSMVARQLPDDVDIDTHFTPTYDPWDQRLCLVPNNDLFKALRAGTASMATDTIDTFVPDGIRLSSGEVLEADVVVTATGLNLLLLGGIDVEVDGEQIDPASTITYRGMMLAGVPNLAFALGYTNASWTLRVDLVSDHVCRLLAHMERQDRPVATPLPPAADQPTRPIIDLTSGYVQRSIDDLPRQGTRGPWRLQQNYLRELLLFRGSVADEGIRFERAPVRAEVAAVLA